MFGLSGQVNVVCLIMPAQTKDEDSVWCVCRSGFTVTLPHNFLHCEVLQEMKSNYTVTLQQGTNLGVKQTISLFERVFCSEYFYVHMMDCAVVLKCLKGDLNVPL